MLCSPGQNSMTGGRGGVCIPYNKALYRLTVVQLGNRPKRGQLEAGSALTCAHVFEIALNIFNKKGFVWLREACSNRRVARHETWSPLIRDDWALPLTDWEGSLWILSALCQFTGKEKKINQIIQNINKARSVWACVHRCTWACHREICKRKRGASQRGTETLNCISKVNCFDTISSS